MTCLMLLILTLCVPVIASKTEKENTIHKGDIWVNKLDPKNPDLIWQLFFLKYLPYVHLSQTSSMLSYQAIQPKKIGTSTDSEKKDKLLN